MTFSLSHKVLLVSLSLALGAPMVHADEFANVDQLLKQGQAAKAQQLADQFLSKHPKDARMRFRKGVSLSDQGKTDAAIGVFSSLVRDYPAMAEARNNLAVLYASKGDFDKAQAELEQALASNPAYSAAHRNLGNIYERQARLAYDRALRAGEKSPTQAPGAKLAMLRGLNRENEKAQPDNLNVAPPPPPARESKKPAPTPPHLTTLAQNNTNNSAAPAAKTTPPPKPTTPVASKPEATKVDTAKVEASAPAINENAILSAVESWAKAWSNKDVEGYFSHYSAKFQAPDGRAAWEQNRRVRITKPGNIKVTVLSPDIRIKDERRVEVRFRQDYKSATFNANSGKVLELGFENGRWLILKETVGSGR